MAHLGSLGRGGAERARARARAVASAREGCAGEGGYAGARMPRPGRGGRRGGGNYARSA